MVDQENLNPPSSAGFFAKIDAGAQPTQEPAPANETPYEAPSQTDFSPGLAVGDSSGTSEVPPVMEPTEIPIETDGGLKKKFLIILLVLVLVGGGLLLVKKLRSPKSQDKEVTLTYWGLWEPEEIMSEAITDYQKSHPKVKITYIQQSAGKDKNYRERLQTTLAKGNGPDIFRFHNTWIPMLRNDLVPVPASVMDANIYKKTFYEKAVKTLESSSGYLGIPLMIDGLALFYNEEIFEARSDVRPPKTWDELITVADKLKVKDKDGRILTAGVALGSTKNVDHWSDILGLLLLQNDVAMNNPTKDSQITTRASGVLTYFTNFYRKYGFWDESLPNSTNYFAAGKLAMYFGPSWRVFEIKALNPKLKFKVVPVPQVPPDTVNWATFWVEGVSKKSPLQTEAWEFLKYLSTKEVMQKLYQTEVQSGRLFGEPSSRTDMADELKDAPYVATFIEQAPTAQGWYLSSNTFDNGINDEIIKYYEDAINAVNQGRDPTDVLETVKMGIDQVLAKYGAK